MAPSSEIWKPIVYFDGLHVAGMYEVSNLGRVQSLDRIARSGKGFRIHQGKVLKPQKFAGYLYVRLYLPEQSRFVRVHRLVATHFLPPSILPEVNHKDLNPYNNAVSNLEWVSRKDNIEHARAAGRLSARVHPSRAHKLDAKTADAIRIARASGMTYAVVGLLFGVHLSTVHKIVNGLIWR